MNSEDQIIYCNYIRQYTRTYNARILFRMFTQKMCLLSINKNVRHANGILKKNTNTHARANTHTQQKKTYDFL
jgi:hypothetical protein